MNLSGTLANSRTAYEAFSRSVNQLIRHTELPAHLREAVILRLGALLGADYEWGHHVRLGRAAGLSDEVIAGIRSGDLSGLDPGTQVAVRYAQAVEERAVSDELWSQVEACFTTSQAVELTMLASFYSLVCRFLLALRVELDPYIEGLEAP
jgi:alkylhydroperoxidase family enzyme